MHMHAFWLHQSLSVAKSLLEKYVSSSIEFYSCQSESVRPVPCLNSTQPNREKSLLLVQADLCEYQFLILFKTSVSWYIISDRVKVDHNPTLKRQKISRWVLFPPVMSLHSNDDQQERGICSCVFMGQQAPYCHYPKRINRFYCIVFRVLYNLQWHAWNSQAGERIRPTASTSTWVVSSFQGSQSAEI